MEVTSPLTDQGDDQDDDDFGESFSEYKILSCKLCDYKDEGHRRLWDHMIKDHPQTRPFQCHHCKYRAQKRGTLNRHIKTVHSRLKIPAGPFYTCQNRRCNLAFKSQKELEDHAKCHLIPRINKRCKVDKQRQQQPPPDPVPPPQPTPPPTEPQEIDHVIQRNPPDILSEVMNHFVSPLENPMQMQIEMQVEQNNLISNQFQTYNHAPGHDDHVINPLEPGRRIEIGNNIVVIVQAPNSSTTTNQLNSNIEIPAYIQAPPAATNCQMQMNPYENCGGSNLDMQNYMPAQNMQISEYIENHIAARNDDIDAYETPANGDIQVPTYILTPPPCSSSTTMLSNRENHIVEVMAPIEDDRPRIISTTPPIPQRTYTCKFPGCQYMTNLRGDFKKHKTIHVNESTHIDACSECQKVGKMMADCHERPFLCCVCGSRYTFLQRLRDHCKTFHYEEPSSVESIPKDTIEVTEYPDDFERSSDDSDIDNSMGNPSVGTNVASVANSDAEFLNSVEALSDNWDMEGNYQNGQGSASQQHAHVNMGFDNSFSNSNLAGFGLQNSNGNTKERDDSVGAGNKNGGVNLNGEKENELEEVHRCKVGHCKFYSLDGKKLALHLFKEHKIKKIQGHMKSFECHVCKIKFLFKGNLVTHMNDSHPNSSNVSSPEMGRS